MKQLPGRGRGLVATRAIPRGSTVLVEAPLIMVRNNQGADAEVRRQYKELSKEQRKCYDSFGLEVTSNQGRVEKIFWKHCLDVNGTDARAMYDRYIKQHTYNVFCMRFISHLRFSLVNHSCAGNALVNTEKGHLLLVVSRRVEKDEEITVNYLDPYIYRW